MNTLLSVSKLVHIRDICCLEVNCWILGARLRLAVLLLPGLVMKYLQEKNQTQRASRTQFTLSILWELEVLLHKEKSGLIIHNRPKLVQFAWGLILPPCASGNPVTVGMSIHISSIDQISEVNMVSMNENNEIILFGNSISCNQLSKPNLNWTERH